MVMAGLVKIAFRNVRLNWHHSLVSLLSISVGFTALTVFEGYIKDIDGVYESIFSKRGMLGDVIIESARSENVLDLDDNRLDKASQEFVEKYLSQSAGVASRVRFLNITGSINNSTTTTVFSGFGFDVEDGAKLRQERWKWDVVAGKPLELGNKNSILLGKELARALGCTAPGPAPQFALADGFEAKERPFSCEQKRVRANVTTSSGQFNATDFVPLGIISHGFQEADARYVLMSLEAAQKLLRTNEVSFFTVKLKPRVSVDAFIASFNAAASSRQMVAVKWQKHRFGDIAARSMEFLHVLRNFIVSIIFVIVFVSVLSALVKSVRERRREIGTMRSMGYPKPVIVTLFSIEGFFLATLGCLFGALLTIGSYFVIDLVRFPYRAGFLSDPDRLRISLSPERFLQSAVVLCLLVTFASVLATRRVTKLKIPENLE